MYEDSYDAMVELTYQVDNLLKSKDVLEFSRYAEATSNALWDAKSWLNEWDDRGDWIEV